MSLLAAIDIGTTLIKAGIFDDMGHVVGMSWEPCDLMSPCAGWFELHPHACWRAVCRALKTALGGPKEIAALGLSSQGQTVVPVDAEGAPLDSFIIWLDRRAASEAEEIESHFGADKIYQQTGVSQLIPGHTAPVVHWWRRNCPEVFSEAEKFLLIKDYAVSRMTGNASIDHQLAGSTACYSVHQGGWWEDMLEFIGLDAAHLSDLCVPHAVAGTLTRWAARDLGLSRRCPVVVGTWDQIAGAIGAGNVRPGIVTEMTGSCLALFATCDDFMTDPERRMLAGRHAVGSYGYLLPYTEFGGKALQAVRNSCYGESVSYEKVTADASRVPIGSDGLRMDLERAGTALDVREAFFNASAVHTRAHMARAAMEAVAFALKEHIDTLTQRGIRVDEVISLGGGAQSDVWLQMKADLLGLPVKRPMCTEAALLGAAVLAGVGCGLFTDVAETAQEAVKIQRVFEPNDSLRQAYLEAYDNRYREG